MPGTFVTERLNAAEPSDLAHAANLLRRGQTVAFPTETVYGLGANALSSEAVARIFEAKQRPRWDPLIVHIAEPAQLAEICTVGLGARLLMDAFWPGPLTLLLPRISAVPDTVTAGRPLVGVRMPAHPAARELLRSTRLPVAAPSANRFGHTSPTTAAHVLADLDGRIAAVLDGGATQVGLESTVAGFAGDGTGLVVYRPGAVTVAMLEQVAGKGRVLPYVPPPGTGVPAEALPSPGVGIRHYAPRARLVLVEGEEAFAREIAVQTLRGERVGAMLPTFWPGDAAACVYAWGSWQDSEDLARRLFSGLRALDDLGATVIVCPLPENDGLGAAIEDRLRKAARSMNELPPEHGDTQ